MTIDKKWIIDTARSIIIDREVSPMLFVSHKDEDGKDGVAVVAFAVPSEYKYSAMRTVGHKFADKECDAIAMISEAWVSKVDMKAYLETKTENLVPSRDPNRTEALVYAMLKQDGEMEFQFYEIQRGLDGPVLIEQPESEGMRFQPLLLREFWKGWRDKTGGDGGFEMRKWEGE